MKKGLYITICLMTYFSLFTSNIMAYPVEILSSSFSVGGGYNVESLSDSYGSAGTTPQSGGVSVSPYPWPTVYAHSNADFFSLSADASAMYFGRNAHAGAQTDITFRPLEDFNTLHFFHYWQGEGYYLFQGYLIDLTDNTVIWNPTAGIFASNPLNPDPFYILQRQGFSRSGFDLVNYAFQSEHLYSLHLYAYSAAAGDHTGVSFGFQDLSAVPEPTTMLLLFLGLIGVAGVRRRLS